MLKKCAIKKIAIASLAFLIMLILCLFPKKESLNIKEEINYIPKDKLTIYTVDNSELVARTEIIKENNTLENVEYLIEALTINNQYSLMLPNGFFPILPEGTKLLDTSLKDNLLKINLSKEFMNLSPQKENQAIESLIYTLCEDQQIKKIMIFVEGQKLLKLPSGKSLPLTLDKNYGINKQYNLNDIKRTNQTTIYYLKQNNNESYYVPITKINNQSAEKVEVIINELQTTPIYTNNLISYLNASYELKEYEILEDSITLSFKNDLIASLEEKDIVESVKYAISLSIRDTYQVDNVLININ